MSWFGDLVSSFAAPIGSVVGGFLDYKGQNSANQANRDIASQTNANNMAIAKSQMDFQERMSNTSWQRGVKDMQAAGINPMLAFSQGGASSPPGAAVGSVTGAPMQNAFGGASRATASAIQALRTNLELEQLREQNRKIVSDRDLNNVLKIQALADAKLKETNARVASQTARNLGEVHSGLALDSEINKSLIGRVASYLQRFNPIGHAAGKLAAR